MNATLKTARANDVIGSPTVSELRIDDAVLHLGTLYTDRQRATAAAMMTTVNAHDDLVAALNKIVQAWPAHGSATDNKMADAMANIARAALAKVQA